MGRVRSVVFGGVALAVGVCSPAFGQQIMESIGSRALGMGGAFVAVADDSSAVYWNPAGLAQGRPAGLTIGWSGFRTGDPAAPASTAGPTSRTSFMTSLGAWPAGVSYAKFDQTALVNAPGGGVVTDTLETSQVAVTLLQTVAPGVVIGANLKYLSGTTAETVSLGGTAKNALDQATTTGGATTSAFDVDLGAMLTAPHVRIGFVVKNLRQPSFDMPAESATSDPFVLKRTARMGVAVLPTSGLTLAMDMDLVTVDLEDGPRKMLAFGAEERIGQRFAVRGGARWNLAAAGQLVGTAGASVAVRSHVWIDLHIARGGLLADRGFGLALRLGL